MNEKKQTYQDKLLDPRWQKKRLEIFHRDNFTCTKCRDKKTTLHVHHIIYKPGLNPWDYYNKYLSTVCKYCHSVLKHISDTFINVSFDEITMSKTLNCHSSGKIKFSIFGNMFGIHFFSKNDYLLDSFSIQTIDFDEFFKLALLHNSEYTMEIKPF